MSDGEKKRIDYNKKIFSDDEKDIMRKEAELVLYKYKSHIPIVVRCNDKHLRLDKNKYLVGQDMTIAQLLIILRKRLDKSLNSSQGLYMFINNKLPINSSVLSSVYNIDGDKDTGMLFVTLCQENTFGKQKVIKN
jgi:hypothetical protein